MSIPGGGSIVGKGLRLLIAERDDWRCVYCGSEVSFEAWKYQDSDARSLAVIDHVIPRSQGGNNDECNLVLACSRCNSGKGNRSIEAWLNGNGKTARRWRSFGHVLDLERRTAST